MNDVRGNDGRWKSSEERKRRYAVDEQTIEMREARVRRSCDRYAAKLAAGRGGLRRDGDAEAQAANYAAGNILLQRLRSETAKVLDTFGVPTIVRPYYYGFILALGKRDRQMWSATQLRGEARVLVSLWVSRGLREDVLLAVARDVLDLVLTDPNPASCQTGKCSS